MINVDMMMDTASILAEEDVQIIKDYQAASIAHKSLIPEQLELVYNRRWFNIWVPKACGGQGYSLPEGLRLLEQMAYVDGSFSWTITLCSGANMFAGFIDLDLAKEVFSQREVCLGGSGRISGKAVWDGERYTITGQWPYATGAPHLSHFTLNAFVYHGEMQQFDADGNPIFRSFFVPKDDVLIHYDWDTFGLESTASHSFSLMGYTIDEKYSFQLDTSRRVLDDPLYRIPFRPFADVTLLVNYLGMYRRFLDLSQKYFFEKSKDPVWEEKYSRARFALLDKYQQQLELDQAKINKLVENIWKEAVRDSLAENHPLLMDLHHSARTIVKQIREAVVDVFPLLGIRAAQRHEELNIVFRNLYTATQHSLLNIPVEE